MSQLTCDASFLSHPPAASSSSRRGAALLPPPPSVFHNSSSLCSTSNSSSRSIPVSSQRSSKELQEQRDRWQLKRMMLDPNYGLNPPKRKSHRSGSNSSFVPLLRLDSWPELKSTHSIAPSGGYPASSASSQSTRMNKSNHSFAVSSQSSSSSSQSQYDFHQSAKESLLAELRHFAAQNKDAFEALVKEKEGALTRQEQAMNRQFQTLANDKEQALADSYLAKTQDLDHRHTTLANKTEARMTLLSQTLTAKLDTNTNHRLEEMTTYMSSLEATAAREQDLRTQQLETKYHQVNHKISQVTRLLETTAEAAVSKVTQVADSAVASISQLRTDFVSLALAPLENRVSAMVQSLTSNLFATTESSKSDRPTKKRKTEDASSHVTSEDSSLSRRKKPLKKESTKKKNKPLPSTPDHKFPHETPRRSVTPFFKKLETPKPPKRMSRRNKTRKTRQSSVGNDFSFLSEFRD
jgi:hypothetical protein